jgi:hypothetical protein
VRKKRKSEVRSVKKMDTSKEIRCCKSGVRDREKIPGIMVLGFRRILSSTMKNFGNKYFIACDLFGEFFGSLQGDALRTM